jgi:CNP1-like family protein
VKAVAALGVLLGVAACSMSEPTSDWERRNPDLAVMPTEALPKPPPAPRRENLIEFYVAPTATFRYFVDAASLATFYKQKEVRYVMVARSPDGVDNVTYEALRCPNEHRILATGNSDGSWNVRRGDWQEIPRRTATAPAILRAQFFCPHNDPIQSQAEGVNALRLGAHPLVYVEQRPAGR